MFSSKNETFFFIMKITSFIIIIIIIILLLGLTLHSIKTKFCFCIHGPHVRQCPLSHSPTHQKAIVIL